MTDQTITEETRKAREEVAKYLANDSWDEEEAKIWTREAVTEEEKNVGWGEITDEHGITWHQFMTDKNTGIVTLTVSNARYQSWM